MFSYTLPKTSRLALVLAFGFALPAGADVTPEDVWQNWQDTGAAMGQTWVAASTRRDGDLLTIDKVTVASAADGITVEGSLEQIIMKDQGDGTVLVTLSPDFPMKMRVPSQAADQPEIQIEILFSQTDMRLIASGTVGDITHAITAPTLKMKLDQIEGVEGQASNFTLDATMSDLAGSYGNNVVDGVAQLNSDITAAGLALALIGSDPAEQTEMRATASMTGLAIKTTGAMLGAALATAGASDLLAQLDSTSDMRSQTTEFSLEVDDANGTTRLNGTMGAGQVTTALSNGTMDYMADQSDVTVVVNAPAIPLPDLSVSLQSIGFGMKLPVATSAEAVPFAFTTRLVNLALSDQIWAMFDPMAALPRDPINLVIDTDGMAKLNDKPADAPQQDTAPPMMVGDLQSLNLKELRLSVAGAALEGKGSSTFEAVPGGLPNPDATLDFTLTGANALMDKLVSAGFIGAEALTMPRMMLALVAQPAADGSDSYQSRIEIKDKAIIANGQKLHEMQ